MNAQAKRKYDANHPYDPDLSTVLCLSCATLFVHSEGKWLGDPRYCPFNKCPDCGNHGNLAPLERMPYFTAPKYKRRHLRRKLHEAKQLARGTMRVIPPQMIVKIGKYNGWIGKYEWTVATGPNWMGLARDDPHRSASDVEVVRFPSRLVVPVLAHLPSRLNIIGGRDS